MEFLAQYSESEGESEEESNKPQEKRLPVPDFFSKNAKKCITKEENSEGKVRSFPHEPGNWATFVYIPLEPSSELTDYFKDLISFFKPLGMKPVDDFHISLTRTVVLRHHWIHDFTATVGSSLSDVNSFRINLFSLKTFTNEERTRSFLSLAVDEGEEELEMLVKCLNQCLGDYNLQTFYQEPSFHMSLLWCPGDRRTDIHKLIDLLPVEMKKFELREKVTHCVCASGNKRVTFNFR